MSEKCFYRTWFNGFNIWLAEWAAVYSTSWTTAGNWVLWFTGPLSHTILSWRRCIKYVAMLFGYFIFFVEQKIICFCPLYSILNCLTPIICNFKPTTHMLKFWHTFAKLEFSVATLFMMSVIILRITLWINEWINKWMNSTVPVN